MAQYQVQDPTGASHVIEGPEGATPDQVVQQAQQVIPKGNEPGMAESFGRGAANNFPLAPQAISALEPGPYSENMADWNAKAAAAKAANPVSYGAGAVTGAVAPLAIPGVGEAMEASPIAANAALGAANAVSNTDILKNPGEAVKEAVGGVGLGGAMGEAGALAGKVLNPVLEKGANALTAKGLNLRPNLLGNIPSEEFRGYGQLANKIGAAGTDIEKALTNAKLYLHELGSDIGKTGAKAMPVQEPGMYVQPLMEKAEQVGKLSAPGAAADAAVYQRGAEDIVKNGKTFEELQDLKSYYAGKAFDEAHQVKSQAAADVYSQINSAMRDIVSNAPGKYQDLLHNYTQTHDIIDGLKAKLGAERTTGKSGGFGMMGALRQLPKGIRYPVAGAATAAGHPYLGAMAMIPEIANPMNQAALLHGAQTAGTRAPAIGTKELMDYFESKEGANETQ